MFTATAAAVCAATGSIGPSWSQKARASSDGSSVVQTQ